MPDRKPNTSCPACGEPIEADWKFCPVCERPLGPPTCPQCQKTVKENWKRCPACGARLLCKSCGRRLPPGSSDCPACSGDTLEQGSGDRPLEDPVTGMSFVSVPAGEFEMGDVFGEGSANEKPVHRVRLSSFVMAKYPVTQAQWMRLMAENPSHFKGEDLPVEQVSWHAAQEFIRKLNQANGGKPAFRLPTETEWEYAARSGGRAESYAGGSSAESVAWYEENSGGMTHAVGERAPNGLGLHDMSGNVWEWCQDLFCEDAYRHHQSQDPLCSAGGTDRVIRGGSWNVDAWSVRCSRRFSLPPEFFGPGLGFRLVAVSQPFN